MITVKGISTLNTTRNTRLHEYMLPQSGAWGGCRFELAPEARKYDWLVVFDDLPQEEHLACPRENTMLVMVEPATYKVYPDNFLRQFSIVACLQKRGINTHPNLKYHPVIWHWGDGFFGADGKPMAYAEMLNMPPPRKNKWLSAVCSDKTFTNFHRRRFEFCTRFAKENPRMDFYGAGTRPIDDKADALLPHHFHLAVENLCERDYWTEKLAESLLAYCVTAYCGCTNIGDYFPSESVLPVDIGDYDSAAVLLNGLDENEYSRRLDAVKEARHILLTKHHPAAKIAGWVADPGVRAAENNGVIRTVKDCALRSGTMARLSHWLKKRRYQDNKRLNIPHKIRRMWRNKIAKESQQ